VPQFPSLDQIKTPQQLPEFEEQILAYWDEIQAFPRSISERPENKPFVFYDGPPFVTGSPHYGSILGSIAKDVVPRYWTMKGYRVERQWGWDCHGLPIENMIEKQLGLKNGKRGIEEFGIANFNNACRAAIAELDATWDVIIRRIGRWVDFKNSYKTMDTSYMESIWWAFSELAHKDLVYEGRKVILYCPRCATPLSNFEIAMDNSYVDVKEMETTYKFEIAPNTYALAWSTTPWTKIGTMALALHPDLMYSLVEYNGETFLEVDTLPDFADKGKKIGESFTGKEAVERFPHFTPHFDWAPLTDEERPKAYRLVTDPFVTADTGTGIVTLAVYGEDDYRVMKDQNIPLYDYVDENGRLDSSIQNPEWVGKPILKVNDAVDEYLASKGLVFERGEFTHSVATCYRCGTRLYYAPLPAWFINIQKLKPDLIKHNEPINWFPDHLKYGRFGNGLKTAPDWNISRSRYWGTPMPVWRSDDGEHTRIISSIADLKEWAVSPESLENLTDIHREFVDDIAVWVDDARTVHGKRVPEVFDVWVESGSMSFAAKHYPFEGKAEFEAAYPAQFISEYIAQTRAWFYTLHVLSVALFDAPSFLNVLTSGVITAADGQKMSKSKQNYTDPMKLINAQGADALRLYLMGSPVMNAENLAFSDTDVAKLRQRVLNMWWNVVSFYRMYQPAGFVANTELPRSEHALDRWILARTEATVESMTANMDTYNLTTATRQLIELVDDVSTWYLRLSRDQLRAGDAATWQTFAWVLRRLALLGAPIVPFISEATYQVAQPDSDSVHLAAWPAADASLLDSDLLNEMSLARKVVEAGHAQRKSAAIKVRQPLASATVTAQPLSEAVSALIATELNVKAVNWTNGEELTVTLDTTLTPELEAEGQAREFIRSVQQLRRDSGTAIDAWINVTAPSWPASFEELIKEKAKITSLTVGDTLAITE
jgi:isoleucyl-tRNA synthetase